MWRNVCVSKLLVQTLLVIIWLPSSFATDDTTYDHSHNNHNNHSDIPWYGATPPSRRYPLHRRGWEHCRLCGGADRLGARLDHLSVPLDDLDDATAFEILDAVRAHGVVVIPSQNLTRAAQIRFTSRLGDVVVLPPSLEGQDPEPGFPAVQRVSNYWSSGQWKGPTTNQFGGYWHQDGQFWTSPRHQLLSVLHAPAHVPPTGGETAFADLRAARKALSGPLTQRAARCVLRASVRDIPDFRNGTEEDLSLFPTAQHDLLPQHALDGGDLLYLGSPTMTVEGLETETTPGAKGRELLRMLFAHATSPSFTYYHAWEKGDVVIWDNTQTLHHAMPYDHHDGKNKRELFRTQARFVKKTEEEEGKDSDHHCQAA